LEFLTELDLLGIILARSHGILRFGLLTQPRIPGSSFLHKIQYTTKDQAEEQGLACTYIQQDIRAADYGDGYGLVMLIFGEFNVFRPSEARALLEKAYRALVPNGFLLLEPHTFEAVVKLGKQPSLWYSTEKGLFSDEPHLCLQESFWDAEGSVAIERYYIISAVTGEVARHSASTQAYTDDQYRSLLAECSFGEVEFYPSMGGSTGSAGSDLTVVLAQKHAAQPVHQPTA
jgi:hypothetical protein